MTQISKEEAAALLRNALLSLEQYREQLEGRLSSLSGLKTQELPAFVRACRSELESWHQDQLQEWDEFVKSNQPSPSQANAVTPQSDDKHETFGVHLRSIEQRMEAMGAKPALGIAVLPKMTPGQLNASGSPAALEMMRAKLDGSENVATPLRQVKQDDYSAGMAPPDSELATAFLRRQQKAQQTTP